MKKLAWGATSLVPEAAVAAWGARAIVQGSSLDVPQDCRDLVSEPGQLEAFLALLERHDPVKLAEIALSEGRVPYVESVTIYEDAELVVAGRLVADDRNYFYLAAYLRPLPQGQSDTTAGGLTTPRPHSATSPPAAPLE